MNYTDNLIEELAILTNSKDSNILDALAKLAIRKVLSLTNRTKMIEELYQYALDYALARYNQLGNEGQSSNSEGGLSVTYNFNDTLKGIEQYRLTKTAAILKKENSK